MAGVRAVLREARSAGLEVQVEGDHLVVRGHPSLRPLAESLLERKGEVLTLLVEEDVEVRWRVDAMRPQVSPAGAIPVLVARQVRAPIGHCGACGNPLPDGRAFRCEPCVSAAWFVVREVKEGGKR